MLCRINSVLSKFYGSTSSEMLHTNSCFVSVMVVSHVASLLFIDFIRNILFVSDIDLMIVVSPPIYLAMQSVALY